MSVIFHGNPASPTISFCIHVETLSRAHYCVFDYAARCAKISKVCSKNVAYVTARRANTLRLRPCINRVLTLVTTWRVRTPRHGVCPPRRRMPRARICAHCVSTSNGVRVSCTQMHSVDCRWSTCTCPLRCATSSTVSPLKRRKTRCRTIMHRPCCVLWCANRLCLHASATNRLRPLFHHHPHGYHHLLRHPHGGLLLHLRRTG